MKSFLRLLCALIGATAFAQPNAIKVQQLNAAGTSWQDRIFAPASGTSFQNRAGFNTALGLGVSDAAQFGTIKAVGNPQLTPVSTIAALKAVVITSIASNTSVYVLGYATPGDGGGGTFNFDSSSSESDNGGTIIQPTSGSGRWLRIFSGAINVRWFGATGNGSTDDTSAVQGAITAGAGRSVYFPTPSGAYKTTSLLTVTTDRTTLIGDGTSTRITSTSTTGAIRVSANYCTIQNLFLNFTGSGGYGIKFYNGTSTPATGLYGPCVNNVRIVGAASTSHGLWIVNALHGTFLHVYEPSGVGDALRLEASAFNNFDDIEITVNTGESVVQWANGITLQSQAGNLIQQSDDNTFVHCVVEGVSGTGILLTSTFGASLVPARNGFYGSTSEGNTGNDILITNGQNNVFSKVHCETSGGSANIEISTTGSHQNAFLDCSGSVQVNNPGVAQGIQGTSFRNHNGPITIAGSNVFGTQIFGCTGVISDSGTSTTYFQTILATSPNSTTHNVITGTGTNDSAAVGKIGEYMSSAVAQGSSQSISNNVVKNLTSITLTAGDWDVFSMVAFDTTTATGTIFEGGASTSNSAFDDGLYTFLAPISIASATTTASFSSPHRRVSVAAGATQVVNLNALASFTIGTMKAWGQIEARRPR